MTGSPRYGTGWRSTTNRPHRPSNVTGGGNGTTRIQPRECRESTVSAHSKAYENGYSRRSIASEVFPRGVSKRFPCSCGPDRRAGVQGAGRGPVHRPHATAACEATDQARPSSLVRHELPPLGDDGTLAVRFPSGTVGYVMIDQDGFRPNVGIIVHNDAGRVIWARRVGQDAWQFPQGGIKAHESPVGRLVSRAQGRARPVPNPCRADRSDPRLASLSASPAIHSAQTRHRLYWTESSDGFSCACSATKMPYRSTQVNVRSSTIGNGSTTGTLLARSCSSSAASTAVR